MKLVLDANVIAKWFIEEENTDKAIKIRDNFVAGKLAILEPSLLIYELGNVFWKHPVKSPEDVENDFKALFEIGLEFCTVREPVFLKNVFEHGRKFGITFYDAVYVTLAEKEDCKLITADAKLQRNVGGRTDVELL
ncbi:PIN domain nuclease [ANME-1 cluster archaeon AG-394-G21]|nr:PIN domain nuclease [ANME-1 cluster archaeon AG-394-G21]NQE54140.1 Ribonuclease VapC3 [ANME-1 cluster archaeon GoMg3.2]